jgi:hypothetical protein
VEQHDAMVTCNFCSFKSNLIWFTRKQVFLQQENIPPWNFLSPLFDLSKAARRSFVFSGQAEKSVHDVL